MTRESKPMTDVDRWNHAVRVAFDDEDDGLDDETDAMSDAEIEAELRAAGVDLDAFHAKMDGLYQQYVAGAASAPEGEGVAWTKGDAPESAPDRPRKIGRGGHVAAYGLMAAAATAGLATYLATRPPEETPDVKPKDAEAPKAPKPAPAPSATPVADVKKMRDDALNACARGAYAECLAGLDEANAVDPAGDADPKLQAARKKATDALAAKGAKGK
jgi:hypothetical protein